MEASYVGRSVDRKPVTTWASTYSVIPEEYYQPRTIQGVQDIVRSAAARGKRIRVVGSCLSPNSCAMSKEVCINLASLSHILMIDRERAIVKVCYFVWASFYHTQACGKNLP
jgi:FAD/FMN-containing dehydrogenase